MSTPVIGEPRVAANIDDIALPSAGMMSVPVFVGILVLETGVGALPRPAIDTTITAVLETTVFHGFHGRGLRQGITPEYHHHEREIRDLVRWNHGLLHVAGPLRAIIEAYAAHDHVQDRGHRLVLAVGLLPGIRIISIVPITRRRIPHKGMNPSVNLTHSRKRVKLHTHRILHTLHSLVSLVRPALVSRRVLAFRRAQEECSFRLPHPKTIMALGPLLHRPQ